MLTSTPLADSKLVQARGKARRKPTSRDVAERAGVAQSTVSAVMSGNRVVAAETKRRVEQAMVDLGYHPNAGARTLRTSRTNVLALAVELVADVDGLETIPYIHTMIERARQQDFDVVLSTLSEGPAGLKRLSGRSICDGVVMMDIQRDDDRVPVAAQLDLPVVLMGRPDDAYGLDVVDYDSAKAARLLVDDLADTGHDTILALGDTPPEEPMLRAVAEFFDQLVERARERKIEVAFLTPSSHRWRDVQPLGAWVAAQKGRKLGVIARTPRSTDWAQRLLAEQGLRPGVDVSIAALCTDDVAMSQDIPITNVSPLPSEVSRRAVEVLLKRIDGDDSPGVFELVAPTALTRRESTVQFARPA